MDNVIHNKKSILQKIAKVCGYTSLILAIVGMCFLIFIGRDLSDVYRASVGAITFFCFMVSLVLTTIGNSNLPILKISDNK